MEAQYLESALENMLEWKTAIAELIFALSHLVWLYSAWAIWSFRRERSGLTLAIRLLLAFTFVWMRFVEPAWITREETALEVGAPARIVLLSDLHLGAYKDGQFAGRLAARINNESADCVLIAGDFLYAPRRSLDSYFAPLKAINKPVYAVFGNHDRHEFGDSVSEQDALERVERALLDAGVRVIENQIVECGAVAVAGVGDHWSGRDGTGHVQAYRGSKPLMMLTHNPDTLIGMQASLPGLTLAGHTHGGQIRIPWLYKKVMPVGGPFDRGLHAPVSSGGPRLFVTSGVGETALPMRLFNPPVLNLLVLR